MVNLSVLSRPELDIDESFWPSKRMLGLYLAEPLFLEELSGTYVDIARSSMLGV